MVLHISEQLTTLVKLFQNVVNLTKFGVKHPLNKIVNTTVHIHVIISHCLVSCHIPCWVEFEVICGEFFNNHCFRAYSTYMYMYKMGMSLFQDCAMFKVKNLCSKLLLSQKIFHEYCDGTNIALAVKHT